MADPRTQHSAKRKHVTSTYLPFDNSSIEETKDNAYDTMHQQQSLTETRLSPDLVDPSSFTGQNNSSSYGYSGKIEDEYEGTTHLREESTFLSHSLAGADDADAEFDPLSSNWEVQKNPDDDFDQDGPQ